MKKIKKDVLFDRFGFNVENVCGSVFRLYEPKKDGVVIRFDCEWKNGLYFNIISVSYNNRCYVSPKYHRKWYIMVREFSYELLLSDCLWDYQKQQPGLISYRKYCDRIGYKPQR